jgi:pseudouridine synthase
LASRKPSPQNNIRLQRYLAACGLGSRRACEDLIREGLVTVDGVCVTAQGLTVDPASAEVLVRGKRVRPQQKVYFALYKPPGILCTVRDTHARPTVLSLVPRDRGRLFPVGRLDADSEGLLFITNDGEFAQCISHPRHHIEKRYQVWSSAALSRPHLASMTRGIRHDGEILRARSIRLLHQGAKGARYEIVLGEGKNRQLRRMFEACDLKITRLKRQAIGPIPIGKLRPGDWRELKPHEIRKLISAAQSTA